jgi:hypothetical protein
VEALVGRVPLRPWRVLGCSFQQSVARVILCAANQFASDRRQQEPRIRHYLAGSNGTGSPVNDVGCCRAFLPLRIECPIRVHQGIHEPFWVPRAREEKTRTLPDLAYLFLLVLRKFPVIQT